MKDLAGKRFFITGGSRGLGLEICKALLSLQSHVVTCARSKSTSIEKLEQKFGDNFSFFRADLSNDDEIQTLIDQAGLVTLPFDGFVANAAIGTDGLLTMMSKPEIKKALDVNLYSTILLTQAVIKGQLASQLKGSLVFISSVCAQSGFKGLSVYAATKAGLCGFSKNLAREYGQRGIRSNVVLPGFLETEMTEKLKSNQTESIRRRTSLQRLGRSSDIVQSVLHLLSDISSYTTGAEVKIDGGLIG